MYSLDSMLSRFFETCVSKLSQFTVPVVGGSSNLRVSAEISRITSYTIVFLYILKLSLRFISQGVRFVTSDDATPVPSRMSSTSDTLPSSQLDTTTGKLLGNAIKSLLSVESHALVQFFPALANQILEVLLVSSAMSQLEATPPSVNTDIGQWLALCQDMISGGACDVTKNAIRCVLGILLFYNSVDRPIHFLYFSL